MQNSIAITLDVHICWSRGNPSLQRTLHPIKLAGTKRRKMLKSQDLAKSLNLFRGKVFLEFTNEGNTERNPFAIFLLSRVNHLFSFISIVNAFPGLLRHLRYPHRPAASLPTFFSKTTGKFHSLANEDSGLSFG